MSAKGRLSIVVRAMSRDCRAERNLALLKQYRPLIAVLNSIRAVPDHRVVGGYPVLDWHVGDARTVIPIGETGLISGRR